jgi:hypothetical protein
MPAFTINSSAGGSVTHRGDNHQTPNTGRDTDHRASCDMSSFPPLDAARARVHAVNSSEGSDGGLGDRKGLSPWWARAFGSLPSLTIIGLSVSAGTLNLRIPCPALPHALTNGETLSVTVTFTRTEGDLAGTIGTVTAAGSGTAQVSLSANGEVTGPNVGVTTESASLGGIPPGSESSHQVGFFNTGGVCSPSAT